MKKILIIVLASILIILLFLFMAFDSRLKDVNYEIESEKVSGEVTLAVIADLHSCLYGENQAEILDELKKASPDAVFLVGDIFDDVYINNNSECLIDNISKTYKTYYVSGNHEWWGGRMYDVFAYLENAGVMVLRGEKDVIEVDGNKVAISGIDDPEVDVYDSYTPFSQQLSDVGNSIDINQFNVLISHRPELSSQYFNYDFDLVIAGHAHGGQFRIPGFVNGVFAPNQGFFPEFAGGMYDFENGKMVVSRGLARENINIPRIFNRPEVVFITIN